MVVLDMVVALALTPVLSAGGRALAWVAALRLAYSAAFAVAIAELTPPDPDRFTRSWDASLLVFGVHLLVVGLLLRRMPSRSRVTSALGDHLRHRARDHARQRLPASAGGLPRDSVLNVTALVTLNRTDLTGGAVGGSGRRTADKSRRGGAEGFRPWD